MSLICLESWDAIATADLGGKGWAASGSTAPAVSSVRSRTGANSLLLTGSSGATFVGRVTRSLSSAEEHATVIVGSAVYRQGSDKHIVMQCKSDSGATTHITLMVTAAGVLEVRRGLDTGTILGTGGSLASGGWRYVELKALLSDTVGTVEVRIDGASVISLTNQDTKNAGAKTVFDTVVLLSGSGTTGETMNFDDVYVANGAGSINNSFIGDMRVRALFPNGNGNSSQLLGSDGNSVDNYLLVDDTTPNTADYVGSATLNQKDTYAFEDLPDTSGTIVGVQVNALATKTDADARNLALVTRSGGTDYDGPDTALALSTNAYIQQIREVDPATSAAWLRAAVNAAEFGAKVR